MEFNLKDLCKTEELKPVIESCNLRDDIIFKRFASKSVLLKHVINSTDKNGIILCRNNNDELDVINLGYFFNSIRATRLYNIYNKKINLGPKCKIARNIDNCKYYYLAMDVLKEKPKQKYIDYVNLFDEIFSKLEPLIKKKLIKREKELRQQIHDMILDTDKWHMPLEDLDLYSMTPKHAISIIDDIENILYAGDFKGHMENLFNDIVHNFNSNGLDSNRLKISKYYSRHHTDSRQIRRQFTSVSVSNLNHNVLVKMISVAMLMAANNFMGFMHFTYCCSREDILLDNLSTM